MSIRISSSRALIYTSIWDFSQSLNDMHAGRGMDEPPISIICIACLICCYTHNNSYIANYILRMILAINMCNLITCTYTIKQLHQV